MKSPLAARFSSRRSRASRPLALVAATLALSAASASAQTTLTYDANTTAPANDGTGVWDTTTANWYNGTTDILWSNGLTDTAIFGAVSTGTGGTVTVAATGVNVGTIQFSPQTTTGYTLSGGTITLGTGITNTSSVGTTINAKISGTNGLVFTGVSGSGTAVGLGGTNDYTGITTLSTGGRLGLSNNAGLGSSAGASASLLGTNYTIINTGTGISPDTRTLTEAFIINGSGVSSAGAIRLVNTNTLSSLIQLGSNSLISGSFSSGNVLSGNIDLQSFTLSTSNTSGSFTGVVGGTGGVSIGSNSTFNFTNTANSFSGILTVGAGTVGLGANGVLGTSTVVFNGGTIQSTDATARTVNNVIGTPTGGANFGATTTNTGTLSFTNTTTIPLGVTTSLTTNVDTTFAAGFSGATFGITKAGLAALILNGTSSYTGATTLNAGTLTVGTGGTLGATTAALAVNNPNTGAGSVGTAVVLNLPTAVDTTVGSLSGTLATPISGTNTATINNGGTGRNFTVNQTAAGTYAGTIAGAGSFTLGSLGTNTLTLSGTNTYTGTTTASAASGVLLTSKAAALPGYNTAGQVIFSGSTIGVQLGTSPTNWSLSELDTLLANATKTSGSLGVDAASGTFSLSTLLTTANLGSLGLSKVGSANTVALTNNSNSYATDTSVVAGALSGNLTGNIGVSTNSVFGNSANAVILGTSASNAGNFATSLFFTAGDDTSNYTMARGIDLSQSTSTGSAIINFNGDSAGGVNTNTLTLAGDINLGTVRNARLGAQRSGMTVNVTGNITGTSASLSLGVGVADPGVDGRGAGTTRFSNVNRPYTAANAILMGTVIIDGTVGAVNSNSPIGTTAIALNSGNSGNAVGGANFTTGVSASRDTSIDTIRAIYLDSATSSYARALVPGGATASTPNGYGSQVNVLNGFQFGGKNTSGTTTFSGAITPNDVLTGSSTTNVITTGINTALIAQTGGTVTFSGIISDTPDSATSQRLTINQFRNSPSIDGVVNSTGLTAANSTGFDGIPDATANQLVGTATTGTVLLSGANSYVGTTEVLGGTLQLGNAAALGFGGRQSTATSAATVASGAVLDLNGTTAVNKPIILNSTGISSGGALINSSAIAASITSGVAGIQLGSVSTGSGYSTAPTVTISGGNGTGATATASLGLTTASIGAIAAGSTGWVTGDYVNITGGGGTGALGQVTASAGVVTAITIVKPGSGYTTAPTGYSKNTSTAGAGTTTFTGNATNFTVSGVTMTSAGSGYTSTPTYTFGSGNAVAGTTTLSSVTLASDSSIGGTGDIAINAVVGDASAAKALTKVGVGKLTLAGANTYTGATTITTGILQLGNAGTTGSLSTSSTITDNANLTINRTNAVVQGTDFSGAAVTGTGSFTQAGAGTTTLNVANGYAGGTALSGGTLLVGNNNALGTGDLTVTGAESFGASTTGISLAAANNVILSTTSVLTLTGANTLTINGSITGSGGNRSLNNAITGTSTLAGNFYLSENDTQGRTLTIGSGATTSTGTTLISGVIANNSGANTAASNLVVGGGGTNILTGANTYTGITTAQNANTVLQVGNGGTTGNLGAGDVALNTASKLSFNRSDAITVNNNITGGTGSLSQIGSGTTTLTGTNSYAGSTTISAGTLQVGNGGSTGTLGAGNVIDNAALVFNRSDAGLTVVNVISGSGSLTQAGTGTTTLTGANSYAGVTNVNAGTLVIAGNQLGNGQINVTDATLQFGNGTSMNGSAASAAIVTNNTSTVNLNFSPGFSISNAITSNSGVTTLSGTNAAGTNNTFVGAATSNGGSFTTLSTTTGATLTFSGSPTAFDIKGTTLNVNGAGNTLISGAIANSAGSGGVVKSGAGTATLSAANTYDGGTTVTAGTLLVNNASGSGTGTGAVVVNNTGTLGGVGTLINAVATTINGGGTITGGTVGAVGTLTLKNNVFFTGMGGGLSTYALDLNGGTADLLAITGNLDLSTSSDNLTLNVLTAPTLERYAIATYTGSLSGTFDNTNLPSNYSLDYSIPNEVDLVVTPVPEPGTVAAGLLAFGTLGLSQRRRVCRWLAGRRQPVALAA